MTLLSRRGFIFGLGATIAVARVAPLMRVRVPELVLEVPDILVEWAKPHNVPMWMSSMYWREVIAPEIISRNIISLNYDLGFSKELSLNAQS